MRTCFQSLKLNEVCIIFSSKGSLKPCYTTSMYFLWRLLDVEENSFSLTENNIYLKSGRQVSYDLGSGWNNILDGAIILDQTDRVEQVNI